MESMQTGLIRQTDLPNKDRAFQQTKVTIREEGEKFKGSPVRMNWNPGKLHECKTSP